MRERIGRRLPGVVALAAWLMLVGGCSYGSTPPADTGIEGRVTRGPMCPVVTEEDPCPDQPYQATIRLETLDGQRVRTVRSDAAGRFRVALNPGVYRLVPLSPSTGAPPQAAEHVVTVESGRYAEVLIQYDTGIR